MSHASGLSRRPTLGILGFGAFGRLMAHHLAPYFELLAYDSALPAFGFDAEQRVTLTSLEAAAGCRVVVLATPMARLADAVGAIRQYLRPGTLVLDVASVKTAAVEAMLAGLPPDVDIVATHPLFGPQSARDGIRGLQVVVCPVRGDRAPRVAAFLRKVLGLDVLIMSADAHDREAAAVQGLTHLIAKVLVEFEPLPTRMTTRSFALLMQAVSLVRHDAPDVFQAITRANPYAHGVRARFLEAAARLHAELQ